MKHFDYVITQKQGKKFFVRPERLAEEQAKTKAHKELKPVEEARAFSTAPDISTR